MTAKYSNYYFGVSVYLLIKSSEFTVLLDSNGKDERGAIN